MVQELAGYWAADYDWRRCEAKLNALPHFVTEIDGLDIHFIHVRSRHEEALPLIVTHGWPGSIIEQLKIIGPLTDPTAHGAPASDAFHLVIPSLPGYGYSGKPRATGLGCPPHRARLGRAHEAPRLPAIRGAGRGLGRGGLERDGAAGTFGVACILRQLPRHDPARPGQGAAGRADPPPASLSADARCFDEQLAILYVKRRAYSSIMGTRPQTLTGIADSPVGLAAWLLDHGDGYGQPAAPVTSAVLGQTVNGHPAGAPTRDDVPDNITLYWLTNTAISSAARLYWENKLALYNAVSVSVPAAVSAFPGEGYQAPRSWTERAYHHLIYYNQPDQGGHFAAWEQPQVFSEEVRAGLRPLRK